MLKLSLQPGEEEKGLVGKLLDKLRTLFRKKQAVAVKEESDKKEVTEDEGDGGKEVDCEKRKSEEKGDKDSPPHAKHVRHLVPLLKFFNC